MTGRPELPVLEPERIERMRTHVMETIRADERRAAAERGRRRARWAMGGAAAAAVVVIGAIAAGGSGIFQAGSSDDAGTSLEDTSGASTAYDADLDGDGTADEGRDAAEPFAGTMIVTGSMSVRVDDAEAAIDALDTFARDHGGRLDGENLDTDGTTSWGEVTVRIPSREVSALRSELERIGTVGSVNVSREDVATQVADVEARIDSLEASIARLRSIIADAASTKDLLEAEEQLAQRQGELESLQAQRRVLRDQTSLATIHVSLSERESAASVEPSGFLGGLTRGWNALVDATNAAVTLAGVLTPWLLPLGAVAGVVLLVRRRAPRDR